MDLRLAAPWNLVCLVAVLPLGAIFLLVRRRTNRALVALALPEQRWPAAALPVALACASFVFVAVAAAEPELRVQRTSPMRTDAQTYVVVDTSTSMLARRSLDAPSRADMAHDLARGIIGAMPSDVPVGLAVMPQGLLPVLAPTVRRAFLLDLLDHVARVGAVSAKPRDQLTGAGVAALAPEQRSRAYVATNLDALRTFSLARFFSPHAKHRLAIVITDAESAAFGRGRVARALTHARVRLLVVRVGSTADRLWRPARGRLVLDRGYSASNASLGDVKALAKALGGGVYDPPHVGQLMTRVRELLGSGTTVGVLRSVHVVGLGPYLALAAIALAALLLGDVLPPLGRRRSEPADAPPPVAAGQASR